MIWTLIKLYWRPLAIAAVLLVVAGGIGWYGHRQYRAGQDDARAEIAEQTRALEIAAQEDRDRADANYRGAVLAREAAQKDTAAVRDRLDRLLRERRHDAANTGPGSGFDGAGIDGIGILIECIREYERVGTDAARLADKVGGLQSYVRAIQTKESRP